MSKALRQSGQQTAKYRAKVRALNDTFRRTFNGGIVMITAGVAALENDARAAMLQMVKDFDAFDDDNDPWGEHDFVVVEHDGDSFFGKIDYYDLKREAHSEDPTDPDKTCRVLTIMLTEEY
jgi:Protein of unknown function (DUF3768)